MSCYQSFSIIAFGGSILIVVGTWYFFLFKKFCEEIANLEGRLEESRSIYRGEIGLNSFEIEQFGNTFTRDYLKFDDMKIKAMGDKLLILFTVDIISFVVVLSLLIFSEGNGCW